MKSARYVRDIKGWTGDASVYELSEPLDGFSLVIVSATHAYVTGPETYIFGATVESLEQNSAEDYSELEGSYRGGLSHRAALLGAGYEVLP